MNEQTNSAELIVKLRAALTTLDQNTFGGVKAESIGHAKTVVDLAGELHKTVCGERAAQITAAAIQESARNKIASPA